MNCSLNNELTFFQDNSSYIKENNTHENTKNSSNPEKEYREYYNIISA